MSESVSVFVLLVGYHHRPERNREYWKNARAISEVEGTYCAAVTVPLLEALTNKYQNLHPSPEFDRILSSDSHATPANTALWRLTIAELDGVRADVESDDEKERLAAYRRDAVRLEAIIRRQGGWELPGRADETLDAGNTASQPPESPPAKVFPRRATKAHQQYLQAVDALGEPDPSDQNAYDQLKAAYKRANEPDELPEFATWQRNLREYRRLAGQQKNKPRVNRQSASRSIVKQSDL